MTQTGFPVCQLSHYLVVAIAAAWLLPHVSATIVVINPDETTNVTIDDSPASFGLSLADLSMIGSVISSDPDNLGCIPESIPPAPILPPMNDTRMNWFIVLMRGNCTFAQKALNAQSAGYDALIVRNEANRPDRSSLICGSPFPCDNITIYITMVSNSDGRDLANVYNFDNLYSVTITGSSTETYLYYVLPFIVVVGVVLLVVASFFLFRFIRDCRNARKARLTRWALRKIPTKKFKKGVDHWDCCSICLDDFADGDKLRILPCDHAYHIKCIDPWLLNNRRNCPVCKRKVRVPGETDSDDEEAGHDRASSTPNHAHQQAINSSDNVLPQNSVLPIGEGRQSGLSQTSNDGAPLIRRDSGGMTCCIPRSYHSTDSLAASSTAPGSSLPATLPSSELSGDVPPGSQPQPTGSVRVDSSAAAVASASITMSLPPVAFLPRPQQPQTEQHRNEACEVDDDDDDDRASHTDTSSVSCTDVSYCDDPSQNSATNATEPAQPVTSTPATDGATSADHVTVEVIDHHSQPHTGYAGSSSDNNNLPRDPGAV